MGALSIWHWIIVLIVVLVLFGGKGKISALMGDLGKGLKSFKKGLKDDETTTVDLSSNEPQRLPEESPDAIKQGVSEKNSNS